MKRSELAKKLGLSKERAELLCLSSFDFRGVSIWFKALSPLDFIDSKTHPFFIYRQGADVAADRQAEAKAKQIDFNDPAEVERVQADLKEAQGKVFTKAILWPKLGNGDDFETVCLNDLFAYPELCNELWLAIMMNSVKKKTRFTYRLKRALKWIGSLGGTASSPRNLPGLTMGTTR